MTTIIADNHHFGSPANQFEMSNICSTGSTTTCTNPAKSSVSLYQETAHFSDSDDDATTQNLNCSRGNLTEEESLDGDVAERDYSFLRSDSAIDLSVVSLDRTSSFASRKISGHSCVCRCHQNQLPKHFHRTSIAASPKQTSLHVSLSLPIYSNGSYADPRDFTKRPPWLIDTQPPRSEYYQSAVSANTNSNNNNKEVTEIRINTTSDNADVETASQPKATQKFNFALKTYNKKSNIMSKHKSLCTIILILGIVTLGTIGALVYFAINPENFSKGPHDIPKTNKSLNQSCGAIPNLYLPEGVTYIADFSPSSQVVVTQGTNDSRTTLQPRVIQGEPANIAQYPWQVALFVENRFVCGASIILSNWIMSAIHCIEIEPDTTKWSAYFGISALPQRYDGEGEKRRIVRVISNHNYYGSRFAYDYDIALLELDRPLPYTNAIQPVCVPPQGFVFPDGMECYISGWGLTNNKGQLPHPEVLQHAQIDIISNETCNRPDWLDNLVTDRMLCAGKIEGGPDSCQGDSGGPLSCFVAEKNTWMLAGIVSWGIECGLPKFPGVYTKISYFTEWIWTKIAEVEGLIPENPTDPDLNGEGSAYMDYSIFNTTGIPFL